MNNNSETYEIKTVEEVMSLDFEDEKDRDIALETVVLNQYSKSDNRHNILKMHDSSSIYELRVFRYSYDKHNYEFIDYLPLLRG